MKKIKLFLQVSLRNKFLLRKLLPVLVFLLSVNGLFAQLAGDFQSKATGNWSAIGTWQTYDGSAWGDATVLPDLTQAITVTIQAGHTVTVDVAYTVNNAALNIIVNGYLKETGVLTKTAGVWTINGTYEFNHASASGSGLPTATWNDGSTCLLTGITSATTGINAAQSFYNLTVNCPSWSGSLNLGWNTGVINIRGNVTASNTGSGRWQFSAPASGVTVTVNIGGNLVIDGSASTASQLVSVTANGTSTGTTYIVINIQGNVTVTGNPTNNAWTNFSISRGSQAASGTSTWNYYGNVNISNAQIQNSTTTTSGGLGKWVFAKSGTQTLTLSSINSTVAPFNIEVLSGSTLNIGSSTLTPSSGFFTLNSGAGIMTSHASGLNGNLTNTGTNTLSTAGNYIFNGTSAQVTGLLLPATVNDLAINNAAGVGLSAPTTANGVLTLTTGTLSLGSNNLTVASTGSISGASASNYIVTDGAGTLTQSFVTLPLIFPVGASTSSYDPVTLTPTTASAVAVNVGTTLPALAPANYSYNAKVWNITPVTPSSTIVTLTPSTAVVTSVSDIIAQYISGSYVNTAATKSGNAYTGTFSAFSPFVTGTTDLGTSIAQTVLANVSFDGRIIRNPTNLDLQVFDTTGRLMVRSNRNINMGNNAKGIYIISSTSGTLKIVL